MKKIQSTLKWIYLITAICIVRVLRPGFKTTQNSHERIIIVHNAKMGDMVCATPMFRAIKSKYPGSQIMVVGNKINEELLQYNTDVDFYLVFDPENWEKMLSEVKDFNADFACVCAPDTWGLRLLLESGIKKIAAPRVKNGFCPWQTPIYKILLLFTIEVSHYMGSYTPREYLKLLEPIGIFTDNTTKILAHSEKADSTITKFFEENGLKKDSLIVGISPTAGNKIKEWSEEKFAEIADYLVEKWSARTVIIGGPNDRERVEEVISKMTHDSHPIMACDFNVDELKALVSKLSLFIAVDTGPIYIAEAYGIPTVDIIGPVDENEQPPRGEKHRVVYLRDRKAPEIHLMNTRVYDYKEARRQIEEINTDIVINEIDVILYGVKNENDKA